MVFTDADQFGLLSLAWVKCVILSDLLRYLWM